MKFTEEMQQVIEKSRQVNGKYPVAERNTTGRLAMIERWQLPTSTEAGVWHVE